MPPIVVFLHLFGVLGKGNQGLSQSTDCLFDVGKLSTVKIPKEQNSSNPSPCRRQFAKVTGIETALSIAEFLELRQILAIFFAGITVEGDFEAKFEDWSA